MPPHCDSLDGPVVTTARQALEAGRVALILPYVPRSGEDEVIAAFDKVIRVRDDGLLAREVADRYFFETVVRIHRAGEGAPFTGLKPAGLSEGPVIPVAERAIETDTADDLVALLTAMVAEAVIHKLGHVIELKRQAGQGIEQSREYVEAMLGFQVWAHALGECIRSTPRHAHHD
jgi:hypothetical protein